MALVVAPQFWLENPVELPFQVTDHFNAPRTYANGLHEGIDLRVILPGGQNSRVLAAQRGVVDQVGFSATGYGHYVRVVHYWNDETTWVTWYGHLSQPPFAQVGDYVKTGAVLGIAGSTGNSTGPHLHLTLQHLGHGLKGYVVDDVLNPFPFFRLSGERPDFEELSFVEDENVPDGTILQPGQAFSKTWVIRNTGTVDWGHNHRLAFAQDDQMGGPNEAALPSLAAGELGRVSLPLIAPNQAGRHVSTWQLRSPQGNLCPFTLYTEIQVVAARAEDNAIYLEDVTVPDRTAMPANTAFIKRWRVRNTGNTTWDSRYHLAFVSDDSMNGPAAVPLTGKVSPAAETVLSVSLTAPDAPGVRRSTWQLRNEQGQLFGETLYAEIEVTPQLIDPRLRRPDLQYIDDVTIQDGTLVQPGQSFQKVWRVKNTGSHAWGAGDVLTHVADDRLGGPGSVPLPAAQPGELADVTVPLVAPAAAGSFRSTWQARSAANELFGETLFAEIRVPQSLRPELDDAKYVKDVTIPDGEVILAGAPFHKTWRIRNTGTTTWGAGYQLRFVSDLSMDGPDTVPLPATPPGQNADVSVSLTAPLTPGLLRSTWQAANPQGQLFGETVYVEITVPDPAPGDAVNNARLESHQTISNGSTLRPGETFEKIWRIRNTGSAAWGAGYVLARTSGRPMNGPDVVAVPATKPDKVASLSVTLTAPGKPGKYTSTWRLQDPAGRRFGSTFFVSINVAGDGVDMLPFLRGDGRLYEMKHIFFIEGHTQEGQEQLQTQTDAQGRFYHVKNNQWEQLWADDDFIYRGIDTSPGGGQFYHLSEPGQAGSPWIPRQMTPDAPFRRAPLVTFQRKDNCAVIHKFTHVTWIKLEQVLDSITLSHPDPHSSQPGLTVQNVAVLAAYNDQNGQPAADWFERYYYAQTYGLIMWEGRGHINGKSWMVEEHAPGSRPPMVRETLHCQPA